MHSGSDDAVQRRFHAEFWRAPAAIAAIGFDGIVLACNAEYAAILGIEPDDLIGTNSADFVCPAEVDQVVAESVERIETGRTTETRPKPIQLRRRDGSTVWVQFDSALVDDGPGDPYVLAAMTDVSVEVEIHAATREAESRFRNAFATSPLGIAFADLDGHFTWVNRALADALGVPEAKLLEMSLLDFAKGKSLAQEFDDLRSLLAGEIESFTSEQWYEHPDGKPVWARLHFSVVRDAAGAPAQLLGQLEDITDRKQREIALTHDALHDPLTGLLNRAGLREHVDLAWIARTMSAPMAVLFGDLDGFKHVNDTLGHDAGDEVLVHVAQRLRTAVRADDIVARWGGDEFVILCPTIENAAQAIHIADRVRLALEAPFRVGPGLAEVGISIGVALDTGQPLPDLLIKDADAAAYRAKTSGRNQVVVA